MQRRTCAQTQANTQPTADSANSFAHQRQFYDCMIVSAAPGNHCPQFVKAVRSGNRPGSNNPKPECHRVIHYGRTHPCLSFSSGRTTILQNFQGFAQECPFCGTCVRKTSAVAMSNGERDLFVGSARRRRDRRDRCF